MREKGLFRERKNMDLSNLHSILPVQTVKPDSARPKESNHHSGEHPKKDRYARQTGQPHLLTQIFDTEFTCMLWSLS